MQLSKITGFFTRYQRVPRPESIFRYRRINEYSLEEFAKNRIYFSTFGSLNDPFEGYYRYTPDFDEKTARELIKAIRENKERMQEYGRSFLGLGPAIDLLNTMSDGEAIAEIRRNMEIKEVQDNVFRKLEEVESRTLGVCCFSQHSSSGYMSWFYGNEHRGVCIEYSTGFKIFDEIKPVQYTAQMPTLIGTRDILEAKALSKSMEWKQEGEWRIIRHLARHDNTPEFDPRALTSVTLGHSVSEPDKQLILQTLFDRKARWAHLPKVYQFRPSRDSYNLSRISLSLG